MLTTASKSLLSEDVVVDPVFWVMNRLRLPSGDANWVFMHRRVEYAGVLHMNQPGSTIVRVCIVQPKEGGEGQFWSRATCSSVFGTPTPSIATPIQSDWIKLSDRHYLVSSLEGEEIDYSHRLSHNLSLHSSTVGGYSNVEQGPIFWCALADDHRAASWRSLILRTIGEADKVVTEEESL